MYVSISVYNDADLLRGCLSSVRAVLPDATVAVVDGRYETWPAKADNSTDATPEIAAEFDASYHPDGPFHRECDKHEHRVDLAPDGERALFLDADERLLDVDRDQLDPGVAYQPRIFNASVYGPKSVYWPRSFKPKWVQNINRWDAYLFDVECEKADAITIVHRHDLRDREYREHKVERFHNEGRASRFEHEDTEHDQLEQYLEDEWELDTTTCPNCGQQSVTRSQITGYGAKYSYVEACLAADGCHRRVRGYELGEYEYLPADWERGFDEDRDRLRVELVDAGCNFVASLTPADLDRMRPAIGLWVEQHLGDQPAEVAP